MAIAKHTPFRRRPEVAATLGVMLLKASIAGLSGDAAPAQRRPVNPTLAGGEARAPEMA